jgi:hypothetical protein
VTKPRRYAEGTDVPVERSRAELEKLLVQHGATAFASGWTRDRYVAQCEMRGRRLRFELVPPSVSDFPKTPAWKAEERRRWRAMVLHVKSKLEMVAEWDDAEFDAEFLRHLVLPSGETVGDRILPELDRVLSGAKMPPLLPGASK